MVFEFFLCLFLQKYHDLKTDLSRTERHILKEMGFICHVEHPHKFISNYLATLETPPELRQEDWNLANDRYFLQVIYLWIYFPVVNHELLSFLFLIFGHPFTIETFHLKLVFFN
jgi:hypothetical protein